ncbi:MULTISPECIES: flagellar basal body L-ring protein FlgH [unclassified Leisingera]|uniref:flagellar basal body L-ring protein FlgH n=1 Tax=unclassified Leisingera TaxID=2614906 RepID=UPI000301E694|nr:MULTISPECIES: flagellar basal body L-ring protein FlgH [unclassified Leisingera]KIC18310.1 flagellar L-ring protein FlgH [Leisingera sp. ANG-DT]KIC24265.1 flagellar L-ring protein FlgH [Leisingera sp. ANG-S3]KIC27943.1 flagellar L-ring protein FlgH [Leisingera sp. ANG-M6]KIC32978.1 flagellar L-ring protein FlgH [Leisingera sp. ANG-S5]KIC52981.1 flagellar L-ring protein FlgH [Leisingera sp. ANG-S]
MSKKFSPVKPLLFGLALLGACGRMDHLGKAPSFTPANESPEHVAMLYQGLPTQTQTRRTVDGSSLWSGSQQSLLGDRRAIKRGDILTVVIEIDEEAEISNDTQRSRSGSETLNMPQLLGLPQRLDRKLPEGASSADAVELGSSSASGGKGSVKRSEKLELRVAATVVDVLPNGVLAISGTQELRVNFELRELLVTGYVRPQDISRQNEITYDKIASARVSYGGRGQITDVQQPRYGQQLLDVVLPF